MNYDFAIAISVYDKFDDVKLIVDIIRENWEGNFYIVVCSSHPDPFPGLHDSKIDKIIKIDPIPFDFNNYSDKEVHLHITLRVLDSIRKSCNECANSDAPYAMHIHADAFPLSWDGIKSLIVDMKNRNKVLAARGDGWGFYTPLTPMGNFCDMFFLFDTKYAKKINLWNFDLYDCLPHKLSIHGCLAFLFLSRIGLSKFYHYAYLEDSLHWDDSPQLSAPNGSVRPVFIHPEYGFLHLHTPDFPRNLGNHLKAYYFTEYKLQKGPHLKSFLKQWFLDKNDLFDQLYQMENYYFSFFKRRGLSCTPYGRKYLDMEKIITEYTEASILQKLRWLISAHLIQLRKILLSNHSGNDKSPLLIFKSKLQKRVAESNPNSRDMVWPDKLNQVYENLLHIPEDAPSNLKELNFDKGDSLKIKTKI